MRTDQENLEQNEKSYCLVTHFTKAVHYVKHVQGAKRACYRLDNFASLPTAKWVKDNRSFTLKSLVIPSGIDLLPALFEVD